MTKRIFKFTNAQTVFYTGEHFSRLKKIVDIKSAVIITDEHIFLAHQKKFENWNTIVLKPGENFKIQATVDSVIEQLIDMQADRKTILIGVGGGVVTDITGYVASIYLRGISFGFMPTSVLAMVDAAIGGKNGIDVGVYKNMVGSIRQPSFIFYDLAFLNTLPQLEWENGFAEIIKHGCIKDEKIFSMLEKKSLRSFQRSKKLMAALINRNALLKIKLVQKDEFENGERRLLNFGHTIGHALENQYELTHGQAIAIGMTYAAHISEQMNGFNQTKKLTNLLEKYHLPTYAAYNKEKVLAVLKMDKKREREFIHFVLLEKIGKAVVQPIPIKKFSKILQNLS